MIHHDLHNLKSTRQVQEVIAYTNDLHQGIHHLVVVVESYASEKIKNVRKFIDHRNRYAKKPIQFLYIFSRPFRLSGLNFFLCLYFFCSVKYLV